MWDFLIDRAEIFGAFALVVILLGWWLKITLDRVKELEADNKDMSIKAIEIMTLATKALENNQGADQEIKDTLKDLKTELRLNSCRYSE